MGCELAVTQSCLGACKITHLLRASGAFISEAALLVHDNQLQQSLNEMFGCEIPPEALMQISCGARNGGLGLRRAVNLALPVLLHLERNRKQRWRRLWLIFLMMPPEKY